MYFGIFHRFVSVPIKNSYYSMYLGSVSSCIILNLGTLYEKSPTLVTLCECVHPQIKDSKLLTLIVIILFIFILKL